ncbi:uncharacterized protein LOC107362002 isoform X1 [Tetranychus urticae]|uniref:uncharacterized protein LOC107362002 isoform X1 n=1 Tax=Tetranychus urticae TaxID=32264 RepID=UPI00077B9149|nr:uncharacterized protein LOC107362002 isoform X1 [Tetranychus urticae]
MLINEIPNDCLLAIFDYIIALDDLINCYQVCVKWSNLIAKRTKRTKYLIDQCGYSFDTVYYCRPCPIDSTYLSKLFTNLTIAELSFKFSDELEHIIQFVTKQKCLKGLVNPRDEPIEKYCDNLEMLYADNFNPNNLRNGSILKQLVIWDYSLEALTRDAHLFPNLERLQIGIRDYENMAPRNVRNEILRSDNPYDGPVLEKLKILELTFDRHHDICYGFQLMDSCPNLQSAYISNSSTNWFIDEKLKHKCLQDLVIDFYETVGCINAIDHWDILRRLFMKYPNLKHLRLRCRKVLTDTHIEQLVRILPNLVLLDVRESQDVTQRAADYVKDHCRRNGRSIKFYFKGNEHEIKSDWPQSTIKYETLRRGFDFMKHCFFKDFAELSPLLVPFGY